MAYITKTWFHIDTLKTLLALDTLLAVGESNSVKMVSVEGKVVTGLKHKLKCLHVTVKWVLKTMPSLLRDEHKSCEE